MANKKEVSRTITGMMSDLHVMMMQEGQYDFMLNGDIEGFDGAGIPIVQNTPSNILCTGFPSGYYVVGFVNVIEQERIIWLLANPVTGDSEIGESRLSEDCRKNASNGIIKGACDDCQTVNISEQTPLEKITQSPCCVYRTIANDDCLNFRREFPVDSIVYRIVDCGIEIFFTDNNNNRRYLVFQYDTPADDLTIHQRFYKIIGTQMEPCEEPIYSTELDCNKLNIQPDGPLPCIEFVDLVSGGANRAGVYQFFIAWADQYGNKMSSYWSSTNIIPIRTKDITVELDYPTDKAIALKINNIDFTGPFEYYKLAVAKTINNFTSFYEVGTFPVGQTTYTYTGSNEAEVKLTVGDIFQRLPYYKSAGHVTASNGIMYWADLQQSAKMNLQRVANKIRLQWQTIAIPEAAYKNPRNVNKFRSAMRDEVYPYGIEFILDNTQVTSAFHIPGRESIPSDLEIIDNDDVVKENNCVNCTEPGEDEEQLLIEEINTVTCTSDDEGIDLVLDNSFQPSGACPLTPYSASGCTPNTVFGTPPAVNAGVDQTITYVASVPLNGTVVAGSYAIISTQWYQLSGPNQVTINNAGILNTYFDNYNAGTYVFQLCAIDTFANVSVDTITFTIDVPDNIAPMADPGADKIVTLPISVSYLNGGGSTDEDGVATYQWSQVSGPNTATIQNSTYAYTNVTGLIAGTYVFNLLVTDIRGCEAEATTTIYVLPDPSLESPDCINLLYPVNGSITSSFNTVILDWEESEFATSYDVYLRTDIGVFALHGTTSDSNYELNGLLPNTIYHWYVIPKNDTGAATGCEDCYRSFVTPTQSSLTTCQKQRWEIYNTGTLEGGDLEIYKECEETCYQYGNFAYWESTERYPNKPEIWGDLCGMPIRHHKYPDSVITHIHDNQNGDLNYETNNVVYPIGVKVDHDSVRAAIVDAVADGVITQAEADSIVGYRIVRGNRFQNKSIVAKGLLYDVNQYRRKSGGNFFDNQNIYFANYPYNDVRSNPFITDDFRNYDDHNKEKGADLPFIPSKRYTFHSPDTHFSEPTIGTKLKLETVEYGMSEGYFTKSKKQARQKFLSNTSYSIAFTAGIIAALMRTEEKEIKEYTVKGTIVSGMGLASGVFGPFLPYQTGTGAAIIPESVLDTIVNAQKSASINAATEVTTRTVQGKYKDWINPVYLAVKKPLLLPLYPLMLLNYASGFLSTVIQEAQIIIDLIESLTPFRDWTVQHHSVGNYNAYSTVPNNVGSKVRSIISSRYMKGENSIISEPSDSNPNQYVGVKVNNWNRESSVYLKYQGSEFDDAGTLSGVADLSRYTLEDADLNCALDKRAYKPISAYYAAIKNYVPDQYGNIYNISYVSTESCMFDINTSNDDCRGVYGGDTYINRFALKIKVPYFLADTFRLPDGTDFNFADYPNLAVPRHYYNSTLGLASEFDNLSDILSLVTPAGIATFLGRPKSVRDCSTNKFFYQNGYIYTYHYGIPNFFVESDVNVDYRHGENLKEKAFYPVQSDLDFWLQQENVPINEDNTYFYNSIYSKQNNENPIIVDGPSFEPNRDCLASFPNGIIYATDSQWLIYKQNNFFEFPLNKGRIVSIEGIENDTVLVRTTNSTSVFKSVLRTVVDGQTTQVGNGGVFSNPPQEFAETTLGYSGTQHKAILHTEFGHIWADAKRGQVFNVAPGASSMDEISKDGKRAWFKENLPFQIKRDFPAIDDTDLDNNLLGLGLCMAFDKRKSRMLLTKLDYKIKNKNVLYNPVTKVFTLNDQVIKLGDKRYFTDKSWTISYNFLSKSWTGYYSFKPNYYLDFIDHFGAGVDSGLWLHNMTNSSFQVFFGKLYPFIFEPILKFEGGLQQLNSLEFDTEVRRYSNEFDYTLKKKIPGVNKMVIYNDGYASGLLELHISDKNDLSKSGKYPIIGLDNWGVEVTPVNFKWRVNYFFNLLRDNSELPIWYYKGNNAEKDLNKLAFNYRKDELSLASIKGQWFKVRMINDKWSNYKILHKFTLSDETPINS